MASMTGFGKGAAHNQDLEITCEIRSVNSRYLDIILRNPPQLNAMEKLIREKVKKHVLRGKVTVQTSLSQNKADSVSGLIQEEKFRSVYLGLQKINEKLHLNDEIKLSHLLSIPGVLEADFSELPEKELAALLNAALDQALDAFNSMRAEEGATLLNDIRQRMEKVISLKKEIDKLARGNVQKEFDRMYANVLALVGEQKIDRDRLEHEIALLSDRVDITEECVRLESHFELLKNTLDKGKEAGKKMTFILQEILREANTINSKNSMVEIQHRVIRIKEELEKMREQAQNME